MSLCWKIENGIFNSSCSKQQIVKQYVEYNLMVNGVNLNVNTDIFLERGIMGTFHLFICCPAKSLQSCPTLCDPINGSPPGSPIPGILQARTLEWVAISFSSAWKWKVKVKSLSPVWLLETPWTAAYQALPSMGFSRQEYWKARQAIAFSDLLS